MEQNKRGISVPTNGPVTCSDNDGDGFCDAYLDDSNTSLGSSVVLGTRRPSRGSDGQLFVYDLTIKPELVVGETYGTGFTIGGWEAQVSQVSVQIRAVAAGAPALASITPASTPAAGGATIKLFGSGFKGATAVTIGGVAASNLQVLDDTSMTVTVPAGTGTGKSVIVTTSGGSNPANALFSYGSDIALASLTPVSGSTTGGTVLTLTGTGFTSATGVTVGGVAATDVVVVSDTTITATAPVHAAGLVAVAVTNGATTSTKANAFTYGIVAQTISFIAPEPVIYLPGGSKQLFATASSGLPVTLTSMTPAVCSVASSRVLFIAAAPSLPRSRATSAIPPPPTSSARSTSAARRRRSPSPSPLTSLSCRAGRWC